MALEAQMLTTEEFASLLTVGSAAINSSAPAIPAAHSARLIALGYMVDLAGKLRMTTQDESGYMPGNSLADGLTVYVGVCNPGDDSHSLMCDAVSSCRIFFRSESVSGPGFSSASWASSMALSAA